jgi:hypothetical protein
MLAKSQWKLQLINPKVVIKIAVFNAWMLALKDLASWIESTLVPNLIYGGGGIVGIAQTPFYMFISSADGLSQLGIDASQPPKLLEAYRRSFRTAISGTTLKFTFGDKAVLKMGTPHPASGTGKLKIESWMEWIIDKKTVNKRGYVPRSKLTDKAQKYIRLQDPLGGLMLPRGAFRSLGFWRFPISLLNYEQDWLNTNIKAISDSIEQKMAAFLTARLT